MKRSGEWDVPLDLERFLNPGPAPAYLGFGIMTGRPHTSWPEAWSCVCVAGSQVHACDSKGQHTSSITAGSGINGSTVRTPLHSRHQDLRTRCRTRQCSSTAARRTERGIDSSGNGCSSFVNYGGKSLYANSPLQIQRQFQTPKHQFPTPKHSHAGTISIPSTSISEDVRIASCMFSATQSDAVAFANAAPSTVFGVPQMTRKSLLRPGIPWSSHA